MTTWLQVELPAGLKNSLQILVENSRCLFFDSASDNSHIVPCSDPRAIWPAVKIRFPERTPCAYGPIAAGAPSVVILVRLMCRFYDDRGLGRREARSTENHPPHMRSPRPAAHAPSTIKCKRGNFTRKLPLCRRDAEVLELKKFEPKKSSEKRATRGRLPADRRQWPLPEASKQRC